MTAKFVHRANYEHIARCVAAIRRRWGETAEVRQIAREVQDVR